MLLQNDSEHTHGIVLRCEQEKKIAIEAVMNNMHQSFAEQDDLKAELQLLRDEVNNRDIVILQLREEQEKSEKNLRHDLTKVIREEILSEAVVKQETELQVIFDKKESEMKHTFADKVVILEFLQCFSLKQIHQVVGLMILAFCSYFEMRINFPDKQSDSKHLNNKQCTEYICN